MLYHKRKKRCNQLIYNANSIFTVTRIGFEPMTPSLEGWCSIQLSYRAGCWSEIFLF